jgi:hypothetical protein
VVAKIPQKKGKEPANAQYQEGSTNTSQFLFFKIASPQPLIRIQPALAESRGCWAWNCGAAFRSDAARQIL